MSALNRLRLLWGYLTCKSELSGSPVEYIVETTAKCNLYCPMCPRESHPQPKADMDDQTFQRLVYQVAGTAEHMMLVGLGEPLLDPKIFDRITLCAQNGISTLLSTNGTLLDEATARRLLESPLEQLTLSTDGITKETFEYYRRGARFEQVQANFLRLARLKHQNKSRLHLTVQMVLMDGNRQEVGEFLRFWKSVPGIDQVRIKQDETDLLQPGNPTSTARRYRCHYLWRGPLYVRHNGDVYPCCQAYMLDAPPLGNLAHKSIHELWNSPTMKELRALHAAGRGEQVDMCRRCRAPMPHPALVIGSLLLHSRTVRRWLPRIERLVYLSRLGHRLLQVPQLDPSVPRELVQLQTRDRAGSR